MLNIQLISRSISQSARHPSPVPKLKYEMQKPLAVAVIALKIATHRIKSFLIPRRNTALDVDNRNNTIKR